MLEHLQNGKSVLSKAEVEKLAILIKEKQQHRRRGSASGTGGATITTTTTTIIGSTGGGRQADHGNVIIDGDVLVDHHHTDTDCWSDDRKLGSRRQTDPRKTVAAVRVTKGDTVIVTCIFSDAIPLPAADHGNVIINRDVLVDHHDHHHAAEADTDDADSWSDDRSSAAGDRDGSQKDGGGGAGDGGRHCDCCFCCELYGHATGVHPPRYPQMRERLRQKLKKKQSEKRGDVSHSPAIVSEMLPEYRGYQSLDDILRYISGGDDVTLGSGGDGKPSSLDATDRNQAAGPGGGADLAAAAAHGKANAKKLRQKQKKIENRKERKRRLQTTAGTEEEGKAEMEQEDEEQIMTNGGDPKRPKDKNDVVGVVISSNAANEENMPCEIDAQREKASDPHQDEELDEIFMPRGDIDLESCDLDEADKEVEMFKRFVMTCEPATQREKIKINMGSVLKNIRKPIGGSGGSMAVSSRS